MMASLDAIKSMIYLFYTYYNIINKEIILNEDRII
jgi:hypothetical protein